MSKKTLKISLIISSIVAVVSIILLLNNAFTPVNNVENSVRVDGEGICEMALPEGALYDCIKYDFIYDGDLYEEEDDGNVKYLGVEKVQKKVKEILPDAVITSYDFVDGFRFNVDTKLNKNLLLAEYEGLFMKGEMCGEGFDYEFDNNVTYRLKEAFTSSPEYLKCKNKALNKARKEAVQLSKLLNAAGFKHSSEYCYVYQIDNSSKIRIFCSVAFE